MNVSELQKNMCTGCGYCTNVCPVDAIEIGTDELGYLFPKVSDKCIDCAKCVKECPYNQKDKKLVQPQNTYAAVRSDKGKLMQSSSGGVFAAIAESVINKPNWFVSGCILNDQLKPLHILTNDKEEIKKIYGSKYVQSTMGTIYTEIANKLANGSKVLFSGTPCQVNAVRKYTHNDKNLYTIEVICHGVSNENMFLSYLELHDISTIYNFVFRDKKQGWSFNNKTTYKNGKIKKDNHRLSSYMTYYLDGETYRDSCYECAYARGPRGADITIGDFWGIIRKRPDLKSKIDIEKGVSCLLVNSEKGKKLIDEAAIECFPVNYEDIKDGNEPLNHPSIHTSKRKVILDAWKKNHNWKDVDKYWRQNDYKLIYKIWSLVPIKFQHFIREMLGKR